MNKRSGKPSRGPTRPAVRIERCVELHRNGQFDAALACYADVPPGHPAHADALHLSGIILAQQGEPARGAELISRAIALSPAAPIFHVNHANALEALGDPDAAERALRRALELSPGLVPALYNLGKLLAGRERLDEAIVLLDRALVAEPGHLNACLVLGESLLKRKMAREALQLARRAMAMAPGDDAASDLLVGALFATDRFDEAAGELGRRLQKDPEDFALLQGRGYALAKSGRLSESVATYRAALAISPEHRDVTIEMALSRVLMGEPEAATATLAALFERAPDPVTLSNLLFQSNYDDSLPTERLVEQHRLWEPLVRLERPAYAHAARAARPRIRVGYVSEDFKQHSVAWFIENVLAAHDRSRFEVFAYFVNPEPDAVTERIRGKVDVFRDLDTKSPAEIAARIRADDLDIAVELSGHTSIRTLNAMLYRPAPVQVSWLGYPCTTATSAIDYRISDAVADPPGPGDAWNTETMLRLPDCFHCYRPERSVSYDPEPPVLRSGQVTFGSFNILAKISPACCAAWTRILLAVPGSRLMLKNRALKDPAVAASIRQRFESAGLPADRIVLRADIADWAGHMACYRELDIALDPFPYNGTTTTCEALWMGVPVLTTAGDRHAARVGASLLTAAGHPELIAPDRERYVSDAIALAGDPQRIAALHRRLHDDFAASPLCDVTRFVAHLESAYARIWQHYCAAHH